MAFHEVRFPTGISLRSQGGPERRTDIVVLGSGFEERNARWADSRRRYNAGYGARSLHDLHEIVRFYEQRRGRLYGFRWRDPVDWKSCGPEAEPTAFDVEIPVAAGSIEQFQLVKAYGDGPSRWLRTITKPVAGSVTVALAGVVQAAGVDFTVDPTTGIVTLATPYVPVPGATVTAGFEFDVPVRFDTDTLEISVDGFRHGSIPSIPIVEIRT